MNIIFWTVLSIIGIIFFYAGVPWMYTRWLRLLLKIRVTNLKALVLTFDDGPGTRLTPDILAMLSEYNVKATFFLLGRNIAGREHIVRQIAAEGHEICSHGYDHLHYWKVSPFRAIRDIKQGWQAIDAVLGTRRTICPFRPPYGKLNLVTWLYLLALNVPIVYWTVDVGDTMGAVHRCGGKRLVTLARKTAGAITLAHDFDRATDDLDNEIIEIIRSVLSMAEETSMRILTVSQLLCDGK